MRMSDFIVKDSVSANLAATTKDGAIREMVENLRGAGHFKSSEPDDIVKAILKRELLGSTGIGLAWLSPTPNMRASIAS